MPILPTNSTVPFLSRFLNTWAVSMPASPLITTRPLPRGKAIAIARPPTEAHSAVGPRVARLRRQGKTDHLGRKRKVLGAKLETVRQLHKEGLSLRAIAAKVHASAMTVQRIIQREQPA
jgi:hypothetical protein